MQNFPEDKDLILKHFDEILEIIGDGLYISDNTGKTLKVNKSYEKLTGLKQEELIGKKVTDLVKEGKYDYVLNPDIVATKKPKTTIQITQKGKKVILNGFPIFDDNGNVILVVTFVRDITLLAQLKEQIAYQQELLNFYGQKKNKSDIIIKSPNMHKLLSLLKQIAETDATVLLLGETGVGKDVLARKIHEYSIRKDGPFFKVDCTSIPENLFESELFGYEPGAFSGANSKGKPGYIELANHGTLFLDEIAELPIATQAKLLRFLQEHQAMRLGSTKAKKVDVRIIAATNRNLEEEVEKGTFRSDLYYRLRVAVLNIPSLRERPEDILPLAAHFLMTFCNKYHKKVRISKEVKEIFLRYSWPGNVRELENLLQGLVITNQSGTIEIGDLPSQMVNLVNKEIEASKTEELDIPLRICNKDNKSLNDMLNDVEKEILSNYLKSYRSMSKMASLLKVDRSTIFRKLKKYNLI